MNSLYQEMMGQQQTMPNGIAQVKNLMNVLRNSNNPQQLFFNMAKQNPQLQQIMNTIQNSNKTPKELFYQMAEQKGVNPEEILKQLQ